MSNQIFVRAAIVAAGSIVSVSAASAATFYNIATIDLAPATTTSTDAAFIGTNPAAVAWDGTDLYVAGHNFSSNIGSVGIVKVSSALTAPTFGTAFGVQSGVPNDRGYVGLDVRNAARFDLLTTFESGSITVSPVSRFTMYNADGTERWNVTPGGRPVAGPALDVQVDRAVEIYQGSRFLRNFNPVTGVSTGNADPVNPSLVLARDVDYNNTLVSGVAVGDAWIRNNNDVYRAQRTGPSTFNSATVAVNLTDANQVAQNIAYLHGIAGTDFAIYNNRATAAVNQAFATVIGAVRDDATAEPLVFRTGNDSDVFAPSNGIAFYDFGWDEASQTLAISDFTNRQVYIFGLAPVPEPASATVLLALAGLTFARRRR